ncbi:hypothetical protein NA57DRAFT_73131 [Rhizodiscina lignyota]|uniref:Uncharacterized protein n=1 Tax=Rhizodiscina lignyota TaxID=1504668 RepID=A0A9P4IHB3_9PEZI|nr:hypothetical protein NA57DRAFT_73131 [Rhizodiscina lignyota]
MRALAHSFAICVIFPTYTTTRLLTISHSHRSDKSLRQTCNAALITSFVGIIILIAPFSVSSSVFFICASISLRTLGSGEPRNNLRTSEEEPEYFCQSPAGDTNWPVILPANSGFVSQKPSNKSKIAGVTMLFQLHHLQTIRFAVRHLDHGHKDCNFDRAQPPISPHTFLTDEKSMFAELMLRVDMPVCNGHNALTLGTCGHPVPVMAIWVHIPKAMFAAKNNDCRGKVDSSGRPI